jgi:hypothetical protein
MVLPFGIFTSCSSPSGGGTTVTKTADVSVAANNFSVGTTLNFAPVFSFTGADASYFNATDITYTLSSADPVKTTEELKIYNGVVPASIYSHNDKVVFTQIFYYNEQEIGRRSIVCLVNGSNFFKLYNDNVTWIEVFAIPAVILQQISKEVTE